MNKTVLAIALFSLCGLGSLNANASVCAANASPALSGANVTAPTVFNGDTCAATDQIVNTCGDATAVGNAKDTIYSVTLGATNSATFSVNGTGFNPYIALMSGAACNSLDGCGSMENAGSAGADIQIGPTGNLPAGQYWLVITDPGNAAGCGTFALTASPTLPVQLQSFSIN